MLYKMGLGLTNHRRISAAALPAGPSAFTVGAWSLTDAAVGGQATVTILSLPVDGGSGLTALQYRIGTGAWTAFAGTSPGSYTVAGFVDGISTPVLVRAVNAIGSGADSDVKAVTTSTGGTVPNQTAPFGAFTLAGAGGFRPFDSAGNPVDLIAVTSPGTGTRTWSIAGGTLVADGAGCGQWPRDRLHPCLWLGHADH